MFQFHLHVKIFHTIDLSKSIFSATCYEIPKGLNFISKGTPLYMSPELVEEKPYDHTADLW